MDPPKPPPGYRMDPHYAILRLLYLYAERIDAGDFDGVGALFADGEIRAPALPRPIRGQDAVTALYRQGTRRHPDGTPLTRHLVCNPVIDVDTTTGNATARSTFVVLQATPDLPLQVIIAGRYHDSFACRHDTWHFTVREMHPELQGDLSHHLLFALT